MMDTIKEEEDDKRTQKRKKARSQSSVPTRQRKQSLPVNQLYGGFTDSRSNIPR